MVPGGILAGLGLVHLNQSGFVPQWLIDSPWLYSGGGTGARTMLGAIASSIIGVAGTVLSITIAALSLAAGQMGPRLLRNFVRDRGNQITLGVFLATFAYALMVLRSVRTQSEGVFVPHLSLSVGSTDYWPFISLAIGASVLAHGVTGMPLTRLFWPQGDCSGAHPRKNTSVTRRKVGSRMAQDHPM